MRVLVTGFEPFNGATSNPSQAVAQALDGYKTRNITVIGRVLPVVFATVPNAITALLDELRPDAVLGTGLAASEWMLRLEMFCSNRIESTSPDNAGVSAEARPIDLAGPSVRQSTVDLKTAAALLKTAKIRARLSYHAGSHCCNLLLYTMIGLIEQRGWPTQAAFIHLPPEETMSIEQMVAALHIIIEMLDP
jgi:pyroglutamyl-peptidase